MALAIVRWRGPENGRQLFDIDIGNNRYYAWAIGSGSQRRDGIRMLTTRSQTSPLLGPLPAGSRGRAVLDVPDGAFTDEHHHLQLISFRDEELRAPAASDIVAVPPRWQPAQNASLSHAQFLETLAGMVSNVLPFLKDVLPTVGQLFGGVPAAAGAPAAGKTGGPQPDLMALLTELLGQVQKALATPGKAASLSRPARRYSQASWVQLLAALPALMPMLEKVLTPETVQTLIGAGDPNKLMTTLFSGLTDAAKIGQQATDKLHEHLRALNPGLGDDMLAKLLTETQSAGGRRRDGLSRQVRLGLADLVPVELCGYPQVAFSHGGPITLAVSVQAPRPIPRARLTVRVKHAWTLRVIAERSWSFAKVAPGRLPRPVTLPPTVTSRLRPGGEYLIDLTLRWRGRERPLSATICQLIRVAGAATFDSVDTGGRPIRLDDVDRDRAWWHRVWGVDLADRTGRVTADLSYTYRLTGGANHNERAETTERTGSDGRTPHAELTGALDVSLGELSRLCRRLTGAAFDYRTMAALGDPSFAHAFDRTAHTSVSIRGRRGGRVEVWVWPEVKLHTAMLRVPGRISPLTGQILSFETAGVSVPIPALAHVVSTRSA